MSDEEQQKDELCVLQSIYTSEEIQIDENDSSGKFNAYLDLPKGFTMLYKNFRDEENKTVRVPIEHLPPITLSFKLPVNYPSQAKPDFTISCQWLSVTKMNRLCQKLDELWESNNRAVILFTWTAFVKEESLSFVGIETELDLTAKHFSELRHLGYLRKEPMARGPVKTGGGSPTAFVKDPRIVPIPLKMLTQQFLVAFNEDRSNTVFLRNIHPCTICFQDKLGDKCIQFRPCKHVYCKECIGGYFEVRIRDGMVESMPCPHEKCDSQAHPHQVKDLVGSQLFSKYDALLLTATLNTMSDITYCPRTPCGCPVMRDTDDVMATCPSCNFVFCIFCKMTYHGVAPCRIKSEEKRKLVQEYKQSDSAGKLIMEKRYGKKKLQALIEDTQSENWIESNSKSCPKCETSIEKSDGCNKMQCLKCQTMFCWLCLTRLDPTRPYDHFMNSASGCHAQLFQGVHFEGDDEDFQEIDYQLEFEEEEDDDMILDMWIDHHINAYFVA